MTSMFPICCIADSCSNYPSVNDTGSVCDQKTSTFLSYGEESMARHLGVSGIY
jgi:hypothetical protein